MKVSVREPRHEARRPERPSGTRVRFTAAVHVESPAPRAAWHDAVAADPLAMADATPAWTDAVCAGRWRDASRAYRLDDGSTVVLPLVQRPGWAASMPPGHGYGGLVGARAHDPGVIRAVAKDLQNLRKATVRVRPLPQDGAAWSLPGATLLPKRAHVLDLTPGPDALLPALRSSVRRAVRRCERLEVEVRVGATPDLLDAYECLWRLSVDRWAAGQGEPLWLARRRAFLRDPPARMRVLAAHLQDRFRLWVAFVDDVPVASNLIVLGAVAHATRANVDVERAPSGVAHYLDWLALVDAYEQGCTAMNLGESGTSESLAFYKEGLGAVPVDYVEARFERLPLTRVDQTARTAVKKLIGFRG